MPSPPPAVGRQDRGGATGDKDLLEELLGAVPQVNGGPLSRTLDNLAEALRYDAKDGARARFTSPHGAVHPSGGHTSADLSVRQATAADPTRAGVVLVFRDREGRAHRSDGPATVVYDSYGRVVMGLYALHGQERRLDGPAALGPSSAAGASSLYTRFHPESRDPGGGREEDLQRFRDLVERGSTPTEAVAWMEVYRSLCLRGLHRDLRPGQRETDHARVALEALVQVGADPSRVGQRLAAPGAPTGSGPAVIAVLAGRAPASWAARAR